MNRIELLSKLVKCSHEDDDRSIENVFSKLSHEFKSLYVFYDIIKEHGIDICRFQSPIIEGDEVTFFFQVKGKTKSLKALDKKKISYKKTKIEYLISFSKLDGDIVALTLSRILKG